ncbi:unnamed protein product [Rotaria sp. Silwood2]|nr:unnamed protein product [Rotaria sp. Silwood2]CAF3244958.1 unnamed protein product [Rotaria sp. Silwood2]CAF3373764.1 unnamed protein product [Rotaria sp. Silwood2]CAF4468476.1 unnamed protein product [Rotaria sp. Silwood2]CAF4612214.1 unnamed protein product [Rotaria sp. Silwood2]
MSNETSPVIFNLETPLTRTIKLILFSVPLGPSLLCSFYIFMCFVRERNLRRRANHIMIAIILIDFLELMSDLVPISLSYFHTGHVHSLSICLYWVTGNYTLQGISSWLMAWASIDRYLLIFFYRLRDTFLRHDVPLMSVCVFVVGWYIILTFTHSCRENWFDGTQFLCGGPCFASDTVIVTADWILIVLLPTLLIVAFNLLLLGRVIFQKCRRQPGFERRAFTWRKNRKLLIQLLAIIFVYFITQLPLAIFSVVRLFGPADFLIDISLIWLFYTPYIIYIIMPFAYIATTKECQKQLSGWQHTVGVTPTAPTYQLKTLSKGVQTNNANCQ